MVSIIVPIYNTASYLGECISSALDQTYPDFELILINDGSADESEGICKKFSREDERIHLISYPDNHGQAYARNKGMDLAAGKYLYFLDSDDMIHPQLLEKMVRQAEETDADLVMTELHNSYQDWENDWICLCSRPFCPKWILLSKEEALERWFHFRRKSSVGGKLFLSESVGNLRFHENVSFSEDYLFNYIFLTEKLNRLSYTNISGYLYRFRQDSICRSCSLEQFQTAVKVMQWLRDQEKQQGREENAAILQRNLYDLVKDYTLRNIKENPKK